MKRPFAFIGFTYLIGLLAAVFLGADGSVVLGIICLILCFLLLFRKATPKRVPLLIFTGGIALLAYFGMYQLNVVPAAVLDGADTVISGRVTELPAEAYGRFYYVIETDYIQQENAPQNLKIRVSSTNGIMLEPYDRLTAKVHLSIPIGSEDGLNTRNYYAGKNIYLTGFIYDYEPYRVTPGTDRPFYYYALKTRETMMQNIRAVLPPNQSSLVCGVLLGDKSGLDETVQDEFRIAGVSHLLAVSGMHMSMIGQFIFWILLYFGLPKRGAALCSSLGVLGFMAVTGFVPSVVRAGIMAILYFLGISIRKQADALNSLGFAILVLTVPNPFAAGDTGLLLSCSATLGILLLSGKIQASFNRWTDRIGGFQRLFRAVGGILGTTVSAAVFTAPIVAFTFGEISLIAPIANLLMTFPATVMLLFGFFTSIFYSLPLINFLAMPFGLGSGILANYLLDCAHWLSGLPFASVPVTQKMILLLLALGAVICTAVVIFQWEGFRLRFAAGALAFLLLCGVFSVRGSEEGVLHVSVPNTGEGSSVVLVRDGHGAVLCSGGGNSAYSSLDRYLKSQGIQQLDFLLISQVDKKTSSGASGLMNEYCPKTVLVSEQKLPQEKLRRALNRQSGVYGFSRSSQVSLWGDIKIQVLANKSESWIMLTAGQEKFLICPAGGDVAEIPAEFRDCNFCVIGETPENAYAVNGDYSIFTMYQEEAAEAAREFSNISNHQLVTSKQGAVTVSVFADGVTIHTEY